MMVWIETLTPTIIDYHVPFDLSLTIYCRYITVMSFRSSGTRSVKISTHCTRAQKITTAVTHHTQDALAGNEINQCPFSS